MFNFVVVIGRVRLHSGLAAGDDSARRLADRVMRFPKTRGVESGRVRWCSNITGRAGSPSPNATRIPRRDLTRDKFWPCACASWVARSVGGSKQRSNTFSCDLLCRKTSAIRFSVFYHTTKLGAVFNFDIFGRNQSPNFFWR